MTVEVKNTHGPTETRIHNIIISLSVAFTRLKVRLRLFTSFIFIYQHVIRPLKHVQKPNQSAGTDRTKVKAHLNTLRHWNIPVCIFSHEPDDSQHVLPTRCKATYCIFPRAENQMADFFFRVANLQGQTA